MEFKSVTLETLGNGAAAELFDIELQKVLENINDYNTKSDTIRMITLKVAIKPNDQRDSAIVGIQVESKLAPTNPYGTIFYFGHENGKMKVLETNTTEQKLPFPENKNDGGIE